MEYENLVVERKLPVAVVTLNRPKVLNALNRKTLEELSGALEEIRDDDSVRAVILTGAGEKAFVAGADISELEQLESLSAQATARFGQRVTRLIESLGKPVIAAVNGFALGGGCELALACTLRIASDKARFGQPEVKLGLIPGYGGTQRLARLVGCGRALELILTGDPISAEEALRIGLVNRVVPSSARQTCSVSSSARRTPRKDSGRFWRSGRPNSRENSRPGLRTGGLSAVAPASCRGTGQELHPPISPRTPKGPTPEEPSLHEPGVRRLSLHPNAFLRERTSNHELRSLPLHLSPFPSPGP